MSRIRFFVAAVVVAAIGTPSASALDLVAEPNVLPDGVVGQAYQWQFEGEDGCPPSYHFALDAGYLPAGLTLNSDGKLVGVPTTPGDYHFFVELTDGEGPGACNSTPSQGDFYLRVLAPLAVSTPQLGPVRVGVPYSVKLQAGGESPVVWSVAAGALPPGFSLQADGTFAGTGTTVGSFSFTARVRDVSEKRTATKDFTFVVAGPLSVGSSSVGPAEVGVPLRIAPAIGGGAAPFNWTVAQGALPAGLSLDAATGVVSGTPAAAGSFALTLSVADALGQQATTSLTIGVAPRLAIATSRLAAARVGTSYRARIAKRGGVGSVAWRIVAGSLPPGLKLNARTGVIAGTPRAAATRRVTVTARDALGAVARRTLVVVVR